MALLEWKRLKRTCVAVNPWWSYFKDELELPGGAHSEYHLVHTEGSSMVVPVQEDGRVILVKQYRYLVGRESIEFPCGGVKAGQSFKQTAEQELAEEAGFGASKLEEVGWFCPYNGVGDEVCRVYLATGLRATTSAPDSTEEFERVSLTPSDLEMMIERKEIWDGMTLAAWMLARRRLASTA